ncbi:pentapeptide repeat-containing protein [Mycobacteriaceae bacterium NPDC060252]
MPLLLSVLLAAVAGFVLAQYLGHWVEREIGAGGTDSAIQLDAFRTGLAMVAGAGGAVALVVAYRRQRDLEQGRFVERFGAAAKQLGDGDAAVRLAGAYAMAGVADESREFGRRQQCIDVLCEYLRLPYDPEQGANHCTEVTTKTSKGDTSNQVEVTEIMRIRQNDRQVRQTIVRIIAAHLSKDREHRWSRHDFDFSGVLFEDADFKRTVFNGESVSFEKSEFHGDTEFRGAEFGGTNLSFMDATFQGRAGFSGATVGAIGNMFTGATFERSAAFSRATFAGMATGFSGASFGGSRTSFENATFASPVITEFGGAVFKAAETTFKGAEFHRSSGQGHSFKGASFEGDKATFESPRMWESTKFDWDADRALIPKCVRPQDWPPAANPDQPKSYVDRM